MANDKTIQAIRSNVARLLREERERQKVSLNALAQRAGISRQMVSFVESEERNPSLEMLLRLTIALNVKLEDVIRNARKLASLRNR